jgi:U2 small nuclear ribonucleoprotein B''
LQRIQFAKSKSDAVAKLEGSFVPTDKRKRQAEAAAASASAASAAQSSSGTKRIALAPEVLAPAAQVIVPHSVLLAQNLPADANEASLKALFGQYAGLKEVRLIAGRGLAFIEFQHETMATPALLGLHNHVLPTGQTMQVTYAKK